MQFLFAEIKKKINNILTFYIYNNASKSLIYFIFRFLPHRPTKQAVDYSNIENSTCKEIFNKKIHTSDLTLLTTNAIQNPNPESGPPKLRLYLGPNSIDYFDFVAQGWRSEQGKERDFKETIEARQVKLVPINKDIQKGKWFSIDNEDYEAKSVQITLLPKVINMFCKRNDAPVMG